MPLFATPTRAHAKAIAIAMIVSASAPTIPCAAQSDATDTTSAQAEHDAPAGLSVVGTSTAVLPSAGLSLEFQQSLESTEGDPKAIDAALASMQSTWSTILAEGAGATASTRITSVRVRESRDSSSYSKSRGGGDGPGSVTWIVRVPDRAAAETVLVRAAALGKQVTFSSLTRDITTVDPATRQAAIAAAGADALKAAEAIISQTNSKVGRLLWARETNGLAGGGSVSSDSVFVFGKRVWMPDIPNLTVTVRLECRFEVLAK